MPAPGARIDVSFDPDVEYGDCPQDEAEIQKINNPKRNDLTIEYRIKTAK
jgi:hypothetical protein